MLREHSAEVAAPLAVVPDGLLLALLALGRVPVPDPEPGEGPGPPN